jgi:hypothetical protein
MALVVMTSKAYGSRIEADYPNLAGKAKKPEPNNPRAIIPVAQDAGSDYSFPELAQSQNRGSLP